MSHYVTPFLVFNLGAEMVYVIAQRLEAQNVANQRATLGEFSFNTIFKHTTKLVP